MALTVLSVAFPFAPVGAGAVGGAEQILSSLDEALTAAGHTSLVAAREGSQVAGELFAVPQAKSALLDGAARAQCRKQMQAAIDRALGSRRVDLVHMHGLDFARYRVPEEIPVLVTLHLPVAWYGDEAWERWRGRARFCCVSQTQRKSWIERHGLERWRGILKQRRGPEADCIEVVENGVELPRSVRREPKEDFAVVMGRICPEKNAHAALEAGTRAGVPVVVCGEVFPYREHREYFEKKMKPLLDGRRGGVAHRFAGQVWGDAKHELLARAKCLLHPTLAPETSSLVAMEALAAGTPVIAYRSGALEEIVEDGVTGFLVEGVEEMAEAMVKVGGISAEVCRATAGRRFQRSRMVREYFALYESLTREEQRVAVNG